MSRHALPRYTPTGSETWRLSRRKQESWRLGPANAASRSPRPAGTTSAVAFRRAAFRRFAAERGLPASEADVLLGRWQRRATTSREVR